MSETQVSQSRTKNEPVLVGGGDWVMNLDLFWEIDYFVNQISSPGRIQVETDGQEDSG